MRSFIQPSQEEKFYRILENYDKLNEILNTLPNDQTFYKNSLLTPKILKNHLEKQIENYNKNHTNESCVNILSAFSKLQDVLRTNDEFSKLVKLIDPSAYVDEKIKNEIDQKQERNAQLEAESRLRKADLKSSIKKPLEIDDVKEATCHVNAKMIRLDIAEREIREIVTHKIKTLAELELKKRIGEKTKCISHPKIKEKLERKIKAAAEPKINKLIERRIQDIENFKINLRDPEIQEAMYHKNRAFCFLIDAQTREEEILDISDAQQSKNKALARDEEQQQKEGELSDKMQKKLQRKITLELELKNQEDSFNVTPDAEPSIDLGYKSNLSQTFFYNSLSDDKALSPTKKITNTR